MSPPPWPGRLPGPVVPEAAPSGLPQPPSARSSPPAAGLLGQAGSAGAATPWPAGRGAQVREQVWLAAPLTGTLRPGMAGTAVRTLQQRLAQLHYYPGPVNGRFGTDTLEAVWAFKEVQGLRPRPAPTTSTRPCSRPWPGPGCRGCSCPAAAARALR